MLAALLSLAMVLTFAGAADLEAPVTATAPADDAVMSIHAEEGALDVFSDAPEKGNWSYEALNCIVANDLMKGNNSKIMPANLLSRAEMTTIMVRVLGAENLSANISKYVDVKRGEWYYDAISAGVATKIINGSGNKMMPKDSITREQAMAILARTFLFEAETNATATFKDKAKISSWALESANALVEREIVLGDAKGNLRPQDNITRAEFATMLHRIVCYFAKADVDYAGKTINGSVILGDANVDLSGATIDGDLYIVEGVGDAKIDLSDVTVTGNIVIRGGDVTVAEGVSVIRKEDVVEDEPVVVPPVVDKEDTTTDRETPNVATTPNGANVKESGTYILYEGANGEKKLYATVRGNTITFDFRKLKTSEADWRTVVIKALYVDTDEDLICTADGFGFVSFETNKEIDLDDILKQMIDSTNNAIAPLLGINAVIDEQTGKVSEITNDYNLATLSFTIDTANSAYQTLGRKELFDSRGIDAGTNDQASFNGKIGTDSYTVVMKVPNYEND